MEKMSSTRLNQFDDLIQMCTASNMYLGWGNPNAQVLFVGKEAALNEKPDWYVKQINDLKEYAYGRKDINFKRYKQDDSHIFISAHTWSKYQKLHDFIFPNIKRETDVMNFEENIFVTEMNDNPAKRTNEAQKRINFKADVEKRKSLFFTHSYIKSFSVIVLACSGYIRNYGEEKETREIDNIFAVKYKYSFQTKTTKKPQSFHVHLSDDGKRLVIHTNQLSGSAASKELLEKLGKVIKTHLDSKII
jgi:hypothetical protein